MKAFWDKNKVFFIGLAGALLISLQQFAMVTKVEWPVLGLALGIAGISFIAKNWRGQGMSIIGILGNVGWAFMTVYDTGHFNLSQFFIQIALTFGFAAMPDQKSRGYESAEAIKAAKVEGEIIQPADLTNGEIKKLAKAHSNQ